jgi:hypothetical protein
LSRLEQGLAAVETIVDDASRAAAAETCRLALHRARAQTLEELGRYTDADQAWAQVAGLSPAEAQAGLKSEQESWRARRRTN